VGDREPDYISSLTSPRTTTATSERAIALIHLAARRWRRRREVPALLRAEHIVSKEGFRVGPEDVATRANGALMFSRSIRAHRSMGVDRAHAIRV
jgi:hypothetical protein